MSSGYATFIKGDRLGLKSLAETEIVDTTIKKRKKGHQFLTMGNVFYVGNLRGLCTNIVIMQNETIVVNEFKDKMT